MSRKGQYPFREMQIGEVRIVKTKQRCFSKYAYKFGQEIGRKFRTFQVGESVRLTRVA